MIIASIDIGSNTVLLLVAEVDLTKFNLKTILNKYESPRISHNLKPGGIISNEKVVELFDILSNYSGIVKTYKPNKVLVCATNAFRIATNSKLISNKIKKRFGWNVEVISGIKEAKLSFLGSTLPFGNDHEEKIVIDIGGGSTEIIYGNSINIKYQKSFQIGVVSLTEKLKTENKDLLHQKDFVQNIFREINVAIPSAIKTIAVAGTPTTLSCINQNISVYDENKVDNSILTLNDITSIYSKLQFMTPDDISKKYGQIVEGRSDVLTAGTFILLILMQLLNIESIVVSSKGLRYGMIIEYMYGLRKNI